jgi:hypothetical protein
MMYQAKSDDTPVQPIRIPNYKDEQAIGNAYRAFMQAKHPGERSPDGTFKYFDPNDNIPDQGMGFVNTPRELMVAPRNKVGPIMLLKIALATRRKPKQAGWYLKLMASWCYIAPTAAACVNLFAELKAEIREKRQVEIYRKG